MGREGAREGGIPRGVRAMMGSCSLVFQQLSNTDLHTLFNLLCSLTHRVGALLISLLSTPFLSVLITETVSNGSYEDTVVKVSLGLIDRLRCLLYLHDEDPVDTVSPIDQLTEMLAVLDVAEAGAAKAPATDGQPVDNDPAAMPQQVNTVVGVVLPKEPSPIAIVAVT